MVSLKVRKAKEETKAEKPEREKPKTVEEIVKAVSIEGLDTKM